MSTQFQVSPVSFLALGLGDGLTQSVMEALIGNSDIKYVVAEVPASDGNVIPVRLDAEVHPLKTLIGLQCHMTGVTMPTLNAFRQNDCAPTERCSVTREDSALTANAILIGAAEGARVYMNVISETEHYLERLDSVTFPYALEQVMTMMPATRHGITRDVSLVDELWLNRLSLISNHAFQMKDFVNALADDETANVSDNIKRTVTDIGFRSVVNALWKTNAEGCKRLIELLLVDDFNTQQQIASLIPSDQLMAYSGAFMPGGPMQNPRYGASQPFYGTTDDPRAYNAQQQGHVSGGAQYGGTRPAGFSTPQHPQYQPPGNLNSRQGRQTRAPGGFE